MRQPSTPDTTAPRYSLAGERVRVIPRPWAARDNPGGFVEQGEQEDPNRREAMTGDPVRLRPMPWKSQVASSQDIDDPVTQDAPAPTPDCPIIVFDDVLNYSPNPGVAQPMRVAITGGTITSNTWSIVSMSVAITGGIITSTTWIIVKYPEGPEYGPFYGSFIGGISYCDFTFPENGSYGVAITAYNSCGNTTAIEFPVEINDIP